MQLSDAPVSQRVQRSVLLFLLKMSIMFLFTVTRTTSVWYGSALLGKYKKSSGDIHSSSELPVLGSALESESFVELQSYMELKSSPSTCILGSHPSINHFLLGYLVSQRINTFAFEVSGFFFWVLFSNWTLSFFPFLDSCCFRSLQGFLLDDLAL